jgi:hypothetical protein
LPAIQVWVNNDSSENVEKIVKTLDDAMLAHQDKKFKAFVIFLDKDGKKHEDQMASVAEKVKASQVMLMYIAPDDDSVGDYKVNPAADVKNTVMLYRNLTVKSKNVNLVADDKGVATLKSEIDDLLK